MQGSSTEIKVKTGILKRVYVHTFYVILLAIITLSGRIKAEEGDAGQGGEFLRYGVGARAMAMGGAYASLADDATAVYWNPAGLAQISRPSFQFMQTDLYLDSQLLYGALAYPHYNFPDEGSKMAFGVGLLGLRMKGFEAYSADDRFGGGSFDDSQMAVSASMAYDRVTHLGRVAAGLNVLAFNHELYGYGDWGAGADIGILAQLINPPRWSLLGYLPIRYLLPWRFGVVYHAATGEELLKKYQDYPNSLRMGISNSDIRLPSLPGKFVLSYQFDRLLSTWRDDDHRLGCEYQLPLYGDFVFSLRGGANLAAEKDEGGYSWGFGLRGCDISLLGWNGFIGVDFAQKPHDMLSSASFFSLRMVFGPASQEKPEFGSEIRPGSVSGNNMIRRFLNYSRDAGSAHMDSSVAAGTRKKYYVAGRELRDRFQAGSYNHTRYDEFIMGITGWLYRIKTAVEDYRDLVVENKCRGGESDNLDRSLREWRSEFSGFLDDCSGRLDKLAREENIDALRYYIKDLMLAGRAGEVDAVISRDGLASRNRAFKERDREYFRALSDADELSSLRKVAERVPEIDHPAYVEIYLKFLLGVREKNIDLLEETAGAEKSDVFALSYYPVTPFMPDGILRDDAILFKNCLILLEKRDMSVELMREMLSDPLDRYTGGSAFNILSANIEDAVTEDDFRKAASSIIRFYRDNSVSNGIFWPR